ncbi:unnamed protein product [Linum trigynum]|uniref:Uncharacterized protein n=1 Tax=Linum trigynum TaxID=586398 RepID=A0AAV2FK90_9ROSI
MFIFINIGEHNHVDPTNLLKERDQVVEHELGVLPSFHVEALQRAVDFLGDGANSYEVLELGVHIVRAADFLEHLIALALAM